MFIPINRQLIEDLLFILQNEDSLTGENLVTEESLNRIREFVQTLKVYEDEIDDRCSHKWRDYGYGEVCRDCGTTKESYIDIWG